MAKIKVDEQKTGRVKWIDDRDESDFDCPQCGAYDTILHTHLAANGRVVRLHGGFEEPEPLSAYTRTSWRCCKCDWTIALSKAETQFIRQWCNYYGED